MSLPKVIVDQIAREIERTLRHRHDSREGCRAIDTDMQIISRVRLIPPFKVHSRALVRNLNANLLQGRTVAQILAEFSSGVSSIGKFGEAEILLGAVKFKEGSNIQITRLDVDNALQITSLGAMIEHGNEYHSPDFSAVGHLHVEADITDLVHDALKIKGKTVDDSGIGDTKVLAYDAGSDKIVYQAAGGGVHGNELHDPDFLPKNGSEALTGNLDFDQNQAVKFVLENLASAPGSPIAGRSYFNTTDKKAYYYDGTQWKEFCPVGGGPVESCEVSLPSAEPIESISEEVTVTETS